VDHIVPRNQGGSDDLSNLQALSFRCNAGKRDGCLPTQEGSTDFRGLQASYATREAGCVFCAPEVSGRVLLENELALCIADACRPKPNLAFEVKSTNHLRTSHNYAPEEQHGSWSS
jgi:hypothetical protein